MLHIFFIRHKKSCHPILISSNGISFWFIDNFPAKETEFWKLLRETPIFPIADRDRHRLWGVGDIQDRYLDELGIGVWEDRSGCDRDGPPISAISIGRRAIHVNRWIRTYWCSPDCW